MVITWKIYIWACKNMNIKNIVVEKEAIEEYIPLVYIYNNFQNVIILCVLRNGHTCLSSIMNSSE